MDLKAIPKESKWLWPSYVEIISMVENEASGAILDIGCGRGELTLALKGCTGIDIRKYGEWNSAPEKFSTYNGIDIPKGRKFGTFLFNNSFEHVREKGKLTVNLVKNNPSAKIILIVPTTKYLVERNAAIPFNLAKKLAGKPHAGLHTLLVHEPSIYGWNFIKEFLYYTHWERNLKEYFTVEKHLTVDSGRQEFFVCGLK